MDAEQGFERGVFVSGCLFWPVIWIVESAVGILALLAIIGIFTELRFWRLALAAVVVQVGGFIVFALLTWMGGGVGWLTGKLAEKFRREE